MWKHTKKRSLSHYLPGLCPLSAWLPWVCHAKIIFQWIVDCCAILGVSLQLWAWPLAPSAALCLELHAQPFASSFFVDCCVTFGGSLHSSWLGHCLQMQNYSSSSRLSPLLTLNLLQTLLKPVCRGVLIFKTWWWKIEKCHVGMKLK